MLAQVSHDEAHDGHEEWFVSFAIFVPFVADKSFVVFVAVARYNRRARSQT